MIGFTLLFTTTFLIRLFSGKKIEAHPVFFIPLMGLAIIGIPLTAHFLFKDIVFYNFGVEVMCFLILSFQAGSLLYLLFHPFETRAQEQMEINVSKLKKIVVITFTLSFISIVMITLESLATAELSFSIINVIALSGISSAARYSGQARLYSDFSFYLSVFTYVNIGLCGILANLRCTLRWKLLIFLSLIIGISISFITGAKALFLWAIIFFLICYILFHAYKNNSVIQLFSIKNIVRIAAAISIILLVFFSVQLARWGELQSSQYGKVIKLKASSYLLGHTTAFAVWAEDYDFNDMELGYYSFTGVFDKLGIKERIGGTYTDFVDIGSGITTNVYSAFRGLIQDFNILTFPFLMVLGFVSSLNYKRMIHNLSAINFVSCFAIYSFFAWSHTASIFAYNIFLLAFFVFGICVKFVLKSTSKN